MTCDGSGVVSHAGSVGLRLLADRVGLTAALSGSLGRKSFRPVHDRGQVLVDVSVMIADGGEAIGDIDVLRHQGQVLGAVASAPTVWRALDELTPAALGRVEVARARVRRHVWSQLDAIPASRVTDTDLGATIVLDVDATLVTAHSEKEAAAPDFKGGFGFHPIGVWCDNTTECLAVSLRPGNAGANTALDHIDVLGRAFKQIPPAHRRRLLVRADGAGATHALLDWLSTQDSRRGRSVEFSVGFATTQRVREAISMVPEWVWTPALAADGCPREGADVAELSGLLDLAGWPTGMRVIVRRERPHPGAQLSLLEEADGWRYQAFATNTKTGQLGLLEARHRAHARGGPHPSRQDQRTEPVPVTRILDQHRVVSSRRHRRGPDRVATPTGPGRCLGPSRTESLALPAAARARAPCDKRTASTPADTANMAVGQGTGGHVRPDHGDPRPWLNTNQPP